MSSPQTRICICQNLGLSNAYQHTFWFDNVTEQTAFFESKVIKTFANYAYVRKNWSLKLGATVAEAEKWGYLFFRNSPTGRYYYYFITDVKYISDDTVELALEMDVLQTYFFDYALQPSFVEREHSATDNIGDNTTEEDLELGYFVNGNRYKPDLGEMCVLVMSNVMLGLLDDTGDPHYETTMGGMFDGIFSGCDVYCYKTSNINKLIAELLLLDEAGKTDAIVSIWMYPEKLIEYNELFGKVTNTKVAGVEFNAVTRPTAVNGYTPKNNKLLTYPFSYLYATNNAGNHAVYRYERFDGGVSFTTEGSIYPDGGIKFTPKNYNGTGFNYDESLTLAGFPTCAWNSDSYKIWLAQNQNQNALGYIAGGASIVGGVAMLATGGGAVVGGGMIAGGVMGIANQLAQKKDAETHPPQSKGQSSSTLNTAVGVQCIHVYQRSITKERAEIIDDFFTMYGYRTLRVKTPNRNVRESFTYTKTQGCLLSGSLCQEDARKIMSIYDNGVTFWQKTVAIGNYSASNTPK